VVTIYTTFFNIYKLSILSKIVFMGDRLCGLVVRVYGYRSRGPGFDSRHFQVLWEAVGLDGVHSASWGQLRSYLEEIVAAPVKKTETNVPGGSVALTRNALYPHKLALLRQQAAVSRSA
jgi:hypothetical protein